MAISTAGDLIAYALRTAGIVGVGQTALAEDATDALVTLRSMLAGWQRKRWLVPALTELVIASTGAQYYTIGPVRPSTIEAAFARMSGGSLAIDYPLGLLTAREEYAAIVLKTLSTFPQVAFLDTQWPTGRIYIWPIPAAGAFELHFMVPEALPTYSRLTDPINLPPEYIEALSYSLAVRLVINYGLEPRPSLVAAMRQALAFLRQANTQIPEARLPPITSPMRGSSVAAGSSSGFQSGFML